MPLKILSLNVWRGALGEKLFRFLEEADADIYCFQEVLSYPKSKELTTESSGGREVKVQLDLLADLQRWLGDYQCFFHPACMGTSFDETSLDHPLLYGLATFVRNGIAVTESSVGMVHESFRWLKPGESPTPRNAHCIRVVDPISGTSVVLAHMHGLWVEAGKADIPERREQAYRLVDVIKSVTRSKDEKLVVCGDFNVLPGSKTFRVLDERLGVYDLVTAAGCETTRTSLYGKPDRFADYLLVNPKVDIVDFRVIREPEVSDHCPLVLTCN